MHRTSSRPLQNPGFSPDDEGTIRGLSQDFATAFNTGNYDHVSALFAPEGVWVASHQEGATSPRAIEKSFRQLGEAGHQDLRLHTMRVDQWGEIAMEIGHYTVAIRLANGTTTIDRGNFVNVWRRLGAWRLLASSWSTALPLLSAR